MRLPDGEPAGGPWSVVRLTELLDRLLTAVPRPTGRPLVVAVDGRGASGKSSLAARLHALAPSSAVVATDDLAWHEPLFGWAHLLADDVLRPLQRGRALACRPPQWDVWGREGVLCVPAGLDAVLVEGTGASQREHADLVDVTVWVQADAVEAERRGIARDVASGVNGDQEQASAFWHEWMAAELPFVAAQRPWERAHLLVNGTPQLALSADEVEIAPPL